LWKIFGIFFGCEKNAENVKNDSCHTTLPPSSRDQQNKNFFIV